MIKNTAKFIGIKQGYLTDLDIKEIINKTAFNQSINGRIPWMHQRKGEYCSFWDELDNDLIKWMNNKMIDILPTDVINKINESCIINV